MNIEQTVDIAVCRSLQRVMSVDEHGVPEADELDDFNDVCIHLLARDGVDQAKLGAKMHALGFYEALGFNATGPGYDGAGAEHRDMARIP